MISVSEAFEDRALGDTHKPESIFPSLTLIKDRLDDLKSATSPLVTLQQTHAWERLGQGAKSGWLSPIEIDETSDAIGADLSQLSGQDARRASSKGFLNLTLEFYLDLLDWIGRNLAAGKRGAPNNPGVLKKSYRRLSVSHFNSDSIRL